jgi:hypothetical protein
MNVFRAALSSGFWITGIAIARYIPRAFRTKQIDGNLFFTEEKRQEYRRRVESVKLNSRRKWGTIEVDQMLHHLNLACGGSQGFYDLPDESYRERYVKPILREAFGRAKCIRPLS